MICGDATVAEDFLVNHNLPRQYNKGKTMGQTMSYVGKVLFPNAQRYERRRRIRALRIVIIVGLVSAVGVAVMILYAYRACRLMP